MNKNVCGQGNRVTSFALCIFSPVHIVTWQYECNVLTASVARWLQPKSATLCHKKLLDSTQSLVTNFQVKSAKSSEILLKNLQF